MSFVIILFIASFHLHSELSGDTLSIYSNVGKHREPCQKTQADELASGNRPFSNKFLRDFCWNFGIASNLEFLFALTHET